MIYKITNVTEKFTKKKDKVYSIQFNNSIIINNINPEEYWASSDKLNCGLIDEIREHWLNNNLSLKNLIGKYVSVELGQDNYGMKINTIYSLNIIKDFKKLLDLNLNKAFYIDFEIYDFLKQNDYQLNIDLSITLKKEYQNMRVKKLEGYNCKELCYPIINSNDILTIYNIEIIFKKFYEPIKYESENINGEFFHKLSDLGINKFIHHFKCSTKMTCSDDYDYWSDSLVLRIGDKLTDEQKSYLNMIYK